MAKVTGSVSKKLAALIANEGMIPGGADADTVLSMLSNATKNNPALTKQMEYLYKQYVAGGKDPKMFQQLAKAALNLTGTTGAADLSGFAPEFIGGGSAAGSAVADSGMDVAAMMEGYGSPVGLNAVAGRTGTARRTALALEDFVEGGKVGWFGQGKMGARSVKRFVSEALGLAENKAIDTALARKIALVLAKAPKAQRVGEAGIGNLRVIGQALEEAVGGGMEINAALSSVFKVSTGKAMVARAAAALPKVAKFGAFAAPIGLMFALNELKSRRDTRDQLDIAEAGIPSAEDLLRKSEIDRLERDDLVSQLAASKASPSTFAKLMGGGGGGAAPIGVGLPGSGSPSSSPLAGVAGY